MPGTSLKNLPGGFAEELRKVGRGIKKLRFFKFTDLRRVFSTFGRKEKIFALSLLALLLVDLVSLSVRFYLSHTVAVPTYGGTYSEGLVGQPRFINPLLAQTQTDQDLSRLIFSGLYKYDNQGNIIPDLADSALKISDDGKTYTAKLKPNLKWQDGIAITADDVVFTIQLLQNADYKSPLRPIWSNITVEKVDDLTIKFTNKNISSPFITNLTLGILPKHIWSSVSANDFELAKYNLEPVGAGPYFVKEISKSPNGDVRALALNSYSNYANGKPYIDEIDLKFYNTNEDLISALHTKDVDAIGFIPFDTKIYVDPAHTNAKVTQIPVYQYQGLYFNLTKSSKVLGDRDVRTALAESINRTDFINDVYSGLALPAYTPILPDQIGYDHTSEDVNKLNLDAANALLDKAGWAKGADGFRAKGKYQLAFTITTNDFVLNSKSADNLKAQWAKIGANVSINIVPTSDLVAQYIRPRNYDALLFAESTGYDPDPFIFWHSSQSQNPGFNLAQYKNVHIDSVITDARTTFDPKTRAADYAEFQKVFLIDLPAIILDQSVFVYEMRSPVSGMNIKALANPEDRFYDVTHWYKSTRRAWK